METIVNAAFVGTGQQSGSAITTGVASIDALIAQIADEQAERKLLLAAGALSLYRQAGQSAEPNPTTVEPTLPETFPPCSAGVAQILTSLYQSKYNNYIPANTHATLAKEHNLVHIAKLLTHLYPGEYNGILSEAYVLLAKVHLRLPHELLTTALRYATENESTRASLLPVLGERGYWLCRFNTSWSWVAQLCLEMQHIAPADMETIWQAGTVGQRAEVLRRVRAVDPAQALAWLTAVWKQEKVDARVDFLATLEIGLSMQDQPLLAQALEDRSERVRELAASLMVHLIDSPQVQRLIKRADELLEYTDSKITVVLSTTIDETWIYDVTMLTPSGQIKTSVFHWLAQVLARVPPVHWEERFFLTPAQFLEALDEINGVQSMRDALVQAALLHNDFNWFRPLLDSQLYRAPRDARPTLIARLPQHEAERTVLSLFTGDYWLSSLLALPVPWSEEFSEKALQIFKKYYQALDKSTYVSNNWEHIMDIFAASLPPSCFDSAVRGWDLAEDGSRSVFDWSTRLDPFLQKINIRKLLIEEIQ